MRWRIRRPQGGRDAERKAYVKIALDVEVNIEVEVDVEEDAHGLGPGKVQKADGHDCHPVVGRVCFHDCPLWSQVQHFRNRQKAWSDGPEFGREATSAAND